MSPDFSAVDAIQMTRKIENNFPGLNPIQALRKRSAKRTLDLRSDS